mgnify:CR=1 FL=1
MEAIPVGKSDFWKCYEVVWGEPRRWALGGARLDLRLGASGWESAIFGSAMSEAPELPPTRLPSAEEDRAVTPLMDAPIQKQVLVCTGKSCAARDSEAVLAAFRSKLIEENLLFFKGNRQGSVSCVNCGSIGFCAIGPAVMVYPDGTWYAHVGLAEVDEIIQAHIKGGKPVERLIRKRLG